jgi:hypothetical protein
MLTLVTIIYVSGIAVVFGNVPYSFITLGDWGGAAIEGSGSQEETNVRMFPNNVCCVQQRILLVFAGL